MNVKCAVIMITQILHSGHRILSGGLCRSRFDGRCHLYCEDSERSHSHFQGIPTLSEQCLRNEESLVGNFNLEISEREKTEGLVM